MNAILKGKWFILGAWIIAIIGLFLIAPNMGDLVKEKGQIRIPDEYSSSQAGKILDEVQNQKNVGEQSTVALVFHHEKKLTEIDLAEAKKAVETLEANKEELGITDILSSFKEEDLKDQLVSKDGKTILNSLTISWNGREADEVSDSLYNAIEKYDVDHYYTSNWMIDQDLVNSSQEGL